ncbi:MAG: succinylglutamate desuccinylase/aspartoacylase family protein [SAR324 cluster bacterium]|nr:succinylglutamate desuccinylase/aspartoacylase family protein [SAR324 cluster bacterium]
MTKSEGFIPTVAVLPPDISAYRDGNTGIPYVTTFDSGKPGPHVMVNALTHGNELCGAHALCFLFEQNVRPPKGKLTLSFANVAAFSRFDKHQPFASRFVDEDFNRLWNDEVLDDSRQSQELARAREFRPLVARVDYLLDIHSMHLPSPALVLTGLQERSLRLAQAVGIPSYVVLDEGHQAGRRMRDYNAFSDPHSAKTALLVECGQHWVQSSVDVARATALYFLRECGIVDAEFCAAHLPVSEKQPQTVVEVSTPVTITSTEFRFAEDYRGFETIKEAGSLIAYDGDQEIRTPYDDCVLVMPTATERAKPGQTGVRLGRVIA